MKGLKAWWRRLFGTDVATFSNDQVISAYALAGTEFGDVVSLIYMGECIGFDALFEQWEAAEQAYSRLGFRTLSVDDFVAAGGWGRDIDPLLRVPRKEGEPVILHAAYYRQHFLHQTLIVNVSPVGVAGTVVAEYVCPSSAHLTEK
jgi:hypothetical protein